MTDKLISETISIDAPPDVVFAIVADPRQHTRIDGSGSVQAMTHGPERLAKGATFGADMRLFGLPYKISNRVVEFEEGRRIAWRHFGGHRWRYELAPTDDGGTVVTESFDYTRHGRLATAVINGTGFPARNRRGIAETLVRLKAAAEADAAVTPR
ncbi:MAG TPA: SRPBCC family protein [Nocardioidaceae bacterium]|nr:SRPBCC family protein [Nocardioidaceae bacterium]